jgi:hypothetical protein
MPTRADPPAPGLDEIDTIQPNGGDRGSANRCLANDHVPLHAPTEMIGSRYPIPLVIVAHRAGEPEILLDGEPSDSGLRDDVVDLHPRASDAR